MLLRKSLIWLAVLAAVVALSSCSGPLQIEVAQTNPPRFKLHGGGSGYLGAVLVEEFETDKSGPNVWVVGPKVGSVSLSHFQSTEITYGELPEGWEQEIPAAGEKAPALIEGKTYRVICHMFDVETRAAVFTIKNGKPIQRQLK
jgi:hypothetical protein